MEKTFDKTDINAITRTMNLVNDLLSSEWNTSTISIVLEDENVEFSKDELYRTWLTLIRLQAAVKDSVTTKTPIA